MNINQTLQRWAVFNSLLYFFPLTSSEARENLKFWGSLLWQERTVKVLVKHNTFCFGRVVMGKLVCVQDSQLVRFLVV